MKFFFKLQTDGEISEDPDGADLADLDAALEEAVQAAREIAAASVKIAREDTPDHLLITDVDGRVLRAVSLADMIPKRLRQ